MKLTHCSIMKLLYLIDIIITPIKIPGTKYLIEK